MTQRARTMGRLLFATLLLLLGTKSPAAAIDLSGDYVGLNVVPADSSSRRRARPSSSPAPAPFGGPIPISASGTVNPVTGAFSVTGELTGHCTGLVISGTGDGEAFSGTYSAATGICASGGTVSGTKCSNGVIDPGENCDDGNHFDGDCCSARCVLDPAGTACTSDGNVCTDDVCNATGTCTHVANTSPCDDSNPCTVGDVCAGGACAGSSGPAGQPCADDSTRAPTTSATRPAGARTCRTRTPATTATRVRTATSAPAGRVSARPRRRASRAPATSTHASTTSATGPARAACPTRTRATTATPARSVTSAPVACVSPLAWHPRARGRSILPEHGR